MDDIITMSYGNGGEKTSKLITEMFLPRFNNEAINTLGDGALLKVGGNIAFSTDSYVINPYFFPGGDIGKLSVCGTVNDLLMCGSIPKYLSLSFIIEEGFSIRELEKILDSISSTANKAKVNIVTGDTKVVDKGHGHGIYINTAGIGERISTVNLDVNSIKKGDKVIVSGNMGSHGIAILSARENLFEAIIESDCAALNEVVYAILDYKDKIRVLRDPTRGGLATTLNEFTENRSFSIEIIEDKIPIDEKVRAACGILGIDPLYSANEGKLIAIVDATIAEELLKKLQNIEISKDAAIIGEVVDYTKGKLLLKGDLGGKRILPKLINDSLPRIC